MQFEIPAKLSEVTTAHKALPNVWARMKIADLEDQSIYDSAPQLPYEIRQVALDYTLESPFTAFLAVDASEVTEATGNTTVPVAVPLPEGVTQDGITH